MRLVSEHDQPSYTVAVHDGCTNIPLAAGRVQEDERTFLENGVSGHGLLRFVHLDPSELITS